MNKLKFYITLMLSVFILLQGCAPVAKKDPKVVIIKEEVVIKPVVVEEVEKPVKDVPPQLVMVLLSGSAKPYQELADEITRGIGERVTQVTLTGKHAHDKLIINDVKASNATQIVAVGLLAAKAVKGIENKQVIFTHVVNYSDLVADNSKGVSGLPSPELLFKDWQKLSPKLSTVAIISGKNLDTYLKRAQKAAKKQGIKLHLEQVTTDKEFIYKSKSLKSVDGQWILPDNRVLSAKALKEVMAYGSRRGRQIVVFSPKLLSFGGFFYVQPDALEIARVVLQRLSDSAGKTTIPGDGVLPVMSHTMGINQNIARQFNLTIPDTYRKNINGE